MAAFSLVFPFLDSRSRLAYKAKWWLWCPGDADDMASEKLRRKLLPWQQLGYVEYTDGTAIDVLRIEETIMGLKQKYDIKAIAYDPWNCESTQQNLTKEGLKCYKFPQSMNMYNEPSRTFERAVIEGRLLHNNNPVLRWMAGNCVIHVNGAAQIMPSKKSSRDKVDGIVAGVMAVGCYLRSDNKDGDSIYENRGFD